MPELHWLGDEDAKRAARRVPYRLLEPVETVGDPASGNWLIQGDNLEALKALMPFYAGRVKCIFIDPPYNTKSAFEHYDDNLEHSQWLSMMYPRLELLRDLLAEDGSIWVTIDDNEGHYLKVVMDEVFGRKNFIANVLWQKVFSPKNTARHFSDDHDHLLVYARNAEKWVPNPMQRSERQTATYRNPDNDPRGPWTSGDLSARNFYGAGTYSITCPGGRVVAGPPNGMYWRVSQEKLREMDADGRIWWGADKNNTPRIKRFLSEVKKGVVPQTLWLNSDVGNTQEAKKEVVALFGGDNFLTPKPERLVRRAIEIATKPGDLVLDSFLGSGTTAAVAHKLKRPWIGIEAGDHARSLCLPRIRKVIEGEGGGISQAVGWSGGGGALFVKLGAPAFNPDGRINPDIRFATLAAYIWFLETGAPHPTGKFDSPLLGTHNGNAIILLYNGILGDRRPEGGNVLTQAVWRAIIDVLPQHRGPRTIYGEASRLSQGRLKQLNATFLQIPYDIRMR